MGIDGRGRVALVTGAAGGMGAAIARLLAECGAVVAVCDIRADAARAAAAELGGAVVAVAGDVSDESDAERIVADAPAAGARSSTSRRPRASWASPPATPTAPRRPA